MYLPPEYFYVSLFSSLVWWGSALIAYSAYRHRKVWNVGEMTWAFFFTGVLSYGLRKLVHLFNNLTLDWMGHLLGIWSAIFLLSAFAFVYRALYQKKKPAAVLNYLPFAVSLGLLVVFGYLYYLEGNLEGVSGLAHTLEKVTWALQGMATMYLMYLLGTVSTGGFIRVYFFAQLSAYSAFMWGLYGLVQPADYRTLEIFELSFVVFGAASIYNLANLIKKLSSHMYGGGKW